MPNDMSFPSPPRLLPANQQSDYNGISRSLALGRILHFEALMRRRLGEVRPQRYVRLHNYYANQNLPPDNVDQPLLINYVKQITDKHTSYLFGQWKDNLLEKRVTPRNKEDLDESGLEASAMVARRIKRFLNHLYESNNMNTVLWQGAKNGSLYGDTIFRLRYDEIYRTVVIESILPEYFHAMWNISDMNTLTEVIIAYPIDRGEALEQYGTSGNDRFLGYQAINPHYLPGIGIYWERWSTTTYQIWIDDVNVVNAPNPYMPMDTLGNVYPGIIPFIHIPNMQGGAEYWGYGDAENVLYLQDEVNRRMADFGDIVNNSAHPIITLQKYTGDAADLPIGPDAVWDLGREGVADRIDGKGPDADLMGYVDKVLEVMFDTSSMPQAAFGSHKGGSSHQTGLALSMAMLPATERAREKRIRWTYGLNKMDRMALYILAIRDPMMLTLAGLTWADTLMYDILQVWSDILPKDRLETVNEYVARSANLLASIQGSLEALGESDVQSEYDRIQRDAAFKAGLSGGASGSTPQVPGATGTAGKNSEQGMGGAPGIPGAIGAGLNKPGAQIKDPSINSDMPDSVGLGSTV